MQVPLKGNSNWNRIGKKFSYCKTLKASKNCAKILVTFEFSGYNALISIRSIALIQSDSHGFRIGWAGVGKSY